MNIRNEITKAINETLVVENRQSIGIAVDKIMDAISPPENDDLNGWIGWLQARIPHLKEGSYLFWLKQALHEISK